MTLMLGRQNAYLPKDVLLFCIEFEFFLFSSYFNTFNSNFYIVNVVEKGLFVFFNAQNVSYFRITSLTESSHVKKVILTYLFCVH